MDKTENKPPVRDERTQAQSVRRNEYVRPRLTVYGDVRDLTLGGSIGFGESGNPNRFP